MSTANDKAVLNSIFNPFLPIGECGNEEESCELNGSSDACTPQDVEAEKLEIEGVNAANLSNIDMAIECFNRAISISPNRASGYNNRAQALRLKGDIDGALRDLNNAINISEEKSIVARQAYCQRGLIRKLKGMDEEAMQDFKTAAKLGSQFAKTIVVQMNPYAALCNQMLKDIIEKLQRGEEEGND